MLAMYVCMYVCMQMMYGYACMYGMYVCMYVCRCMYTCMQMGILHEYVCVCTYRDGFLYGYANIIIDRVRMCIHLHVHEYD